MDFTKITKKEALEYCYDNADKYRSEQYAMEEDGVRQFDCLIGLIESDTIKPSELPDYGMNFEIKKCKISGTQKVDVNYMQVIEMTREEKIAMFMKMKKIDIIEMLLENQRLVEMFRPKGAIRIK